MQSVISLACKNVHNLTDYKGFRCHLQGNRGKDEIYISYVTKGLLKTVTVLDRWQYLAGLWQGSPGASASIYGAVSPIGGIHRFRNQGMKMRAASLTVTPSDPLAKFLLPVPETLYSAGLVVLVPKGRMLPPADTAMIY